MVRGQLGDSPPSAGWPTLLKLDPGCVVHGYLAHTKQRFPRTLQKDIAKGLMMVLGRGAVSYERGTLVQIRQLWSENEPAFTKVVRPYWDTLLIRTPPPLGQP